MNEEIEEKAARPLGLLTLVTQEARERFAKGGSPNIEGFSFADAQALLAWIEELVRDRS